MRYRRCFSEANRTEKAFTVLADQGLVLVPVVGVRGTNNLPVRGTQLVDFDRGGLTLRGLIEDRSGGLRAAAVASRLLALSTAELLTVDAADRDRPVVRGRVSLRHGVDRVWVVGPHLLQVERGNFYFFGETPAELRVSDQETPWSALTRVPLAGPPIVGESLHQGRLYLVQGTGQTTQPDPAGMGVITNRARLTLTVFDATRLPALPMLSQTLVEPPDYCGGALVALWPNEQTLVWRSSGRVPSVIPTTSPIQPTMPLWWWPRWVPPPPRLFAFDLTGLTPQFASDLTLPGTNQASYGPMFAADGRIFAGRTITVPWDQPSPMPTPTNFLRNWWPDLRVLQSYEVVTVDFRPPAQPMIRPAIRVPGQLTAVARQGALWFALGPHAIETNNFTTYLHALAYDGAVASLAAIRHDAAVASRTYPTTSATAAGTPSARRARPIWDAAHPWPPGPAARSCV